MHKIDDFTFREVELEEDNKEHSEEQNFVSRRITELYFQLVDLEKSQYKDIPDEEFINKLNTDVYEEIKEAAYLGHGKSEIEFDRDKGICNITLYTKHILLNDNFGMSPSYAAHILKKATWSKVSIENEFIKVHFMFDINKHVKVADYSHQIEELKNELKSYIKQKRDF